MKKIITAIDNTEINKLLKKEEDIKIISKDISYKEGILEQLEKNKEVDIIIINEKIDGEIQLNQLIKKIKEKIKNIEIIIITENKNKIINEIYRFKKIKIYETNKIKIKKLISIINNENSNKEKDIKKEEENIIISISGAEGVGKTVTSIIFSKINLKENNLIIDFNKEENQDMPNILNIENKNNIQKINKKIDFISTNKILKIKNILNKYEKVIIDLGNKIKKEEKEIILKKCNKNIILIEPNIIGIKKGKKIINEYLENLKIEKDKIVILINKKNKYSIDKEIIQKIFKNIKIIGEIKNNYKYDKFKKIKKKYKKYRNKRIAIKKYL